MLQLLGSLKCRLVVGQTVSYGVRLARHIFNPNLKIKLKLLPTCTTNLFFCHSYPLSPKICTGETNGKIQNYVPVGEIAKENLQNFHYFDK
jgi:hypothetical protein